MAPRPRRGQALSFEMEHICEGVAPGGFCYHYPQREVVIRARSGSAQSLVVTLVPWQQKGLNHLDGPQVICTIVIFLQNIVVIGLEKAGQLRRGPSVIIPPLLFFL